MPRTRRNASSNVTDSPAFRRWFGKSAVVDERGAPRIVYHGTSADFETFRSLPQAHLGFHFGTTAAADEKLKGDARRWRDDDKRHGAAPEAIVPEDIRVAERARIRKEESRLTAERYAVEQVIRAREEPVDLEALMKAHGNDVDAAFAEYAVLARKRTPKPTAEEARMLAKIDAEQRRLQDEMAALFSFRRPGERVIPVYLSIQNPLRMKDTNWGDASMIKKDHPHLRLRGRTPAEIRNEIEARGFDGIVYENAVEDVGSLSWIAFHPTQIKSATGNRGTFDAADPDIRRNPRVASTASPAFKRWFGKSAVVDAEGKPLVVYHGTTAGDFDAFRPNYRKGEQLGFGIHFAQDRDFAAKYAEDPNVARRGKSPKVYAVYLSIQNPLNADAFVAEGSPEFALAKKLAGARLLAFRNAEGIRETFVQRAIDQTSAQRAEKLIREAGYDGILYESVLSSAAWTGTGVGRRREAASRSFLVFEPTQIKAAVGNVGTFDPADPDIRRNPTPRVPRYVYHLTYASDLPTIASRGLVPQQDTEAAWDNEPGVYFVSTFGYEAGAPESEEPAWLRFPAHSALPARFFDGNLHEGHANHTFSPSDIDVWVDRRGVPVGKNDKGRWVPLLDAVRPTRKNPAPRVPRGFRDLAAWSKWADGQGVDLRLSRTPYGGVEITDLFAHTTGTGAGTRVVTALVSAADTAGMPLVLEPSSRRNITFYERFGFVVSPRGTAMIRSPRRSR
jgi:hypothetical protein